MGSAEQFFWTMLCSVPNLQLEAARSFQSASIEKIAFVCPRSQMNMTCLDVTGAQSTRAFVTSTTFLGQNIRG